MELVQRKMPIITQKHGGVLAFITRVTKKKIVEFLNMKNLLLLIKTAFFFDNCETCIQPVLFSWSLIFLKLSELSKTKTGRYFFL